MAFVKHVMITARLDSMAHSGIEGEGKRERGIKEKGEPRAERGVGERESGEDAVTNGKRIDEGWDVD